MKRNKKGFTLVELVIVIAVIAILAGVMIAVFSGVVRRANENAELQQVKNDELKQKAEDVLTKLDNANWFSWEDFENSLAAKLTEAYKNSAAAQLTTEQIQDAVKKALEDYAKNNATENSQLTETQVKVIIENAISEAKLGGVTEAQVRTIVNTAVGSINTVSKADIQRIVDAATSKGLTAEQVAKVINDAGLATSTQLENASAKVNEAITAINALKPVTKKDVSDAIIDLVPVTYTINTADDLADALARVKSFSTLNFTSEYTVPEGGVEITLPESDDRVLIIKGVELSQLTVNAPGATVYLATDAGNVLVTATAGNSFHVVKNVETLTIKKGRVVVEDNAVVTTLTALPSTDVTVTVRIEEEGTVKNLFAQYQDHGYTDNHRDFIIVENNGTVGTSKITASADLQLSNTTTTNVTIKNGPNAKGTEINDVKVSNTYTDENDVEVTATVPAVKVLFVDNATGEELGGKANNEKGKVEELVGVARIETELFETLAEAITASKTSDVIYILKDIDVEPAIFNKEVTLSGNGQTLKFVKSSENNTSDALNVFKVNGELTIDLNGKAIQGKSYINSSYYEPLIINNGKLTIKDSVGGGQLTTNSNNANAVALLNLGDFVLESGTLGGPVAGDNTFKCGTPIIVGSNSTTTINGGKIIGDSRAIGLSMAKQTLTPTATSNDTSFNSTFNNKIIINGGTLASRSAAIIDLTTRNNGASYCDETTNEIIINGGTFQHVNNDAEMTYKSDSTIAIIKMQKGHANITINDGTFNASNGNVIEVLYESFHNSKFTIKGGNFTTSESKYVLKVTKNTSTGDSPTDIVYNVDGGTFSQINNLLNVEEGLKANISGTYSSYSQE